MTPKHLGQAARVLGHPKDTNPFDPDISEISYNQWNTGWLKTNRDIIVWNLMPEDQDNI
jgi:hypothetical protein